MVYTIWDPEDELIYSKSGHFGPPDLWIQDI
jgi:hypothetical protein